MSLIPKAKPFARLLWRIQKTAISQRAFPQLERDVRLGPMSDQELARTMQQISAFAQDTVKNPARRLGEHISFSPLSWLGRMRKSQENETNLPF
jgi:hypothetical protein